MKITKLYKCSGSCHWFLFLACNMMVNYCYPQHSTLKHVSRKDYDKWYTLKSCEISYDGSWVGYRLDYSNRQDTVRFKQVGGKKLLSMPGCSRWSFIGKGLVSCSYPNGKHEIVDLEKGSKEELAEVTEIKPSYDGRFLLCFKKDKKQLIIKDRVKSNKRQISGVDRFIYSQKNNALCMAVRDTLGYALQIYYLNGPAERETILKPEHRNIVEFRWSSDANKVTYALAANKEGTGIVGYYDLKQKKRTQAALTTMSGFPDNHKLVKKRELPLRVSKDGKGIFFVYTPITLQKHDAIPQIWKADEPYIYNGMSYRMQAHNIPKVGYINIENGNFMTVTDPNFPKALISPDEKYALVYDPAKYQPQSRMYPPMDIYKMDLRTGKRTIFLERHVMDLQSLNFSPSGRYVVYFKNGEWWCFDTKSDSHINLNAKLSAMNGGALVYNSPHSSYPKGWTEGEKFIFMHDGFDIWKVAINNEPSRRLTFGREKKISYRLINEPDIKGGKKEEMGIFLEQQTLLLSMEKNTQRGVSVLKPNGAIKNISFGEQYLRNIKISSNGGTVVYTKERYDEPQKLILYHINSGKLQVLFQSNPHYKKYKSGLNQIIRYRNRDGKELLGILRYPVDYRKDSLYPMVVRVYEKQNQLYNQYKNPGLYNGTGYNLTNLVHKGYFVFLPDIEYKIGEPGFSAADCIVSGTNKALDMVSIDPKRVGLIGHSFGAYETLFTITQSHLFQTAIASAGVADFPREYLYLADTSVLNFNMYEHSQSRMGKSLFEDYQGYLDNSPLYHAKSIQTPLLLWCGLEDYHVNYYQSLSFHLAMKRMGKKNTLLMYPKEDHIISNPENQMDLTIRVEQWLDHYLKGKPKLDWMP